MTEDELFKKLGDIDGYVSFEHDPVTVLLDGNFTITNLELIIAFMKERNAKTF
jgi:hypothetical protein